MATTNVFQTASGSSFEGKLYSSVLLNDTIMGEPLFKELMSAGVINLQEELSRNKGGNVTVYNEHRLQGKGSIGDNDVSSATTGVNMSAETIYIDQLNSPTVRVKMNGTISAQRHPFDLEPRLLDQTVGWFKQRMIAGLFNQLGGNNATSITFDGETLTGDERKTVTGLQIPTAPSSGRQIWATEAANIDTDQEITSSHTLTLSDFDTARKYFMTQTAGTVNPQLIKGKDYELVALVGVTGMNQLIQEAATNAATLSVSTMFLNQLAGGSKDTSLRSVTYRGIKYIEVPDHYVPFGVDTSDDSAETDVKRAIVVGANALDLCLGQGYTDAKGTIPGFEVRTDIDELNKVKKAVACGILGMKKRAPDSKDLSTVVISHYFA